MVIKSDFGIYSVLEKHLRMASDPMTCVDLFERADVRKYAASANKVSDYLGHMWRRQLLDRYHAPASSTSLARYAYLWKKAEDIPATQTVPVKGPRKKPIEIVEREGLVELRVGGVVITIRSA